MNEKPIDPEPAADDPASDIADDAWPANSPDAATWRDEQTW